jgi:hypothetical protein
MITPEATIIHYDGASDKVLSAKVTKLLSGKVLFMKKHWPKPRRIAGIALLELLVLVRIVGLYSMSFVIGSQRYHSAAREWRDVWLARRQWAQGYRPLPSDGK